MVVIVIVLVIIIAKVEMGIEVKESEIKFDTVHVSFLLSFDNRTKQQVIIVNI